jgi:Xaa-Pro aminopeptidase
MRMPRDYERIKRIQNALHEADWDALVCARASNVLLLTGYWPVIGTSIAVATREGKIGLIVPEDERELVTEGNVDELEVFKAGSLEEIVTPAEKASPALARLGRRFNIKRTSGFEHESRFEPTSYAGVHSYSGTLREILAATIPVNFVPADKILSRLRAAVTPIELARIRLACCIADRAYATGATQLCPGLTEIEAGARFRALLSTLKVEHDEVERADGFAYCMSGPNAANAFAAYQRSGSRQIKRGDLLLVHCNSWADGYWTDITRTYCCGEPPPKARQMLEAVLAARQAALEMIRPGIKASQVDLVTRDVIKEHGFEKEFKHPTGHGVGFAAINHLARPRLHPASDEVLAPGMVFNVEPGVYVSGYGGVRHCDMVSVTETAAEVLTPFHAELSDLILKARS